MRDMEEYDNLIGVRIMEANCESSSGNCGGRGPNIDRSLKNIEFLNKHKSIREWKEAGKD
jgi:hypothetical protein